MILLLFVLPYRSEKLKMIRLLPGDSRYPHIHYHTSPWVNVVCLWCKILYTHFQILDYNSTRVYIRLIRTTWPFRAIQIVYDAYMKYVIIHPYFKYWFRIYSFDKTVITHEQDAECKGPRLNVWVEFIIIKTIKEKAMHAISSSN